MSIKSYELSDFFRQLSLLVKSKLPLPESLHNIANNSSKREFQKVVNDIASQVENGTKLSEALKEYPFYFSEYEIKMIEAGERSGSLPEVMKEIATTLQVNNRILNLVRSASYYPLLVMFISFCMFIALNYFVVGEFKSIYDELLAGEPLPPLTQGIIFISGFISENIILVLIVTTFIPVFAIWLLGSSITAKKCLMKLIVFIPFAQTVFSNLLMARFCVIWATLMDRKVSDAESFKIIAESIGNDSLSRTFYTVSKGIEAGEKPAEALRNTRRISHLIPTIVTHAGENDLPEELRNLADIFWDKANFASKRLEAIWQTILIIALAFVAGTTATALFLPLIRIIEVLG
jgi:type IV pilus assembly protein PilC